MKFNLIGSKKSSREGTQNYCTGQNVVNVLFLSNPFGFPP